jgi:hypothetical protein
MSALTRCAAIAALLGALVAAPAPAASAAGIPPNALDRMDRDLVACWLSGAPLPGNPVPNVAGGPMHGVNRGAAWEDGALRFDGTDDYVDVRLHRKLADLRTGSISVWFKANSAKWGECIQPIFYYGSAIGGERASGLIIELGHFWPDRKTTALYFTIMGSPGQRPTFCFDSVVDLELGTWHHFVAVMGEDFNTGYMDGVEMTGRNYNFGTATDNEFFADVVAPAACTIGKGWYWIYGTPCFFDGSIGETRIYSRPLEASDVQALYNGTRPGAAARGAVAHRAAGGLHPAAGGLDLAAGPVTRFEAQPNPFRGATRIRFSIAERTHATVRVYGADGRLVATLLRGTVEPGLREVAWDGRDAGGRAVATGVYFCRLDTERGTLTRKVILDR